MRNFLIPALLLLFSTLVSGNDAKVLKKNELRITAGNLAYMTGKEFDGGWAVKDSPEIFLDNVAGILEYGILKNLTGAVLLVPGVNVFSSVENDSFDGIGYLENLDEARTSFSGVGDIAAGVKFKGQEGRIVDFALSTGLTFPLDKFDLVGEIDNYCNGEDVRISSQSATEGIGFTFSTSTDLKLTQTFTLNIYSGLTHHFPVKKYSSYRILLFIDSYHDLIDNYAYTPANAKEAAKNALNEKETYNYGTDIELEIEPRWEVDLTNQSRIGFRLPLNYQYSPDIYMDGEKEDSTGGYIYSINPTISFMTYKHIPAELILQYNLPLYGINKGRNGAIILSARVTLGL